MDGKNKTWENNGMNSEGTMKMKAVDLLFKHLPIILTIPIDEAYSSIV